MGLKLLGLFIGGGMGTLCRYGLSMAFNPVGTIGFPKGTLLINILGCFFIGLLAAVFQRHASSGIVPLLAITGFLGGFTTFSAFGLETVALLRAGQLPLALLYVGASLVLGLLAVYTGSIVARL